jgi:hypothetical protein
MSAALKTSRPKTTILKQATVPPIRVLLIADDGLIGFDRSRAQ